MKPTSFNYAEYARLQTEMERKNEYVNALIAENVRLQKQLDAAVEDLHKTHYCGVCTDAGCVNDGWLQCPAWKWRGERGE